MIEQSQLEEQPLAIAIGVRLEQSQLEEEKTKERREEEKKNRIQRDAQI